jgi:hypothetical protein
MCVRALVGMCGGVCVYMVLCKKCSECEKLQCTEECTICFSSKKALELNDESSVDSLSLWNVLGVHCFVYKFENFVCCRDYQELKCQLYC